NVVSDREVAVGALEDERAIVQQTEARRERAVAHADARAAVGVVPTTGVALDGEIAGADFSEGRFAVDRTGERDVAVAADEHHAAAQSVAFDEAEVGLKADGTVGVVEQPDGVAT